MHFLSGTRHDHYEVWSLRKSARKLLLGAFKKSAMLRTLRTPTLPSVSRRDIHPTLRGYFPRERGAYWWTTYQLKLEDEIMDWKRVVEHGTFYVFLEEECTFDGITAVVRYGNVFMTDHWVTSISMAPKGEEAQEGVVNVMERRMS
jgi:hypothetical protein